MTPLFKKLNLKTGGAQPGAVVVMDAPASFEAEIAALVASEPALQVRREGLPGWSFALAFAIRQTDVERALAALVPAARGDVVLWFAYPKQSSKRYRCDFNRDTGFDGLRAAGFDSVRIVAIDDDWSALRFRRVEAISR